MRRGEGSACVDDAEYRKIKRPFPPPACAHPVARPVSPGTTRVLSTRTTPQAARTTADASTAYPRSNRAAVTTASTSVEHNVWVRYAGSHDTKSVYIR